MSFKREGNDGSWLRSLQNRRVSELFSEDIPDGEAHLMKNGKFACMVCSHRPVFDTVTMLGVHRNGKKHIASAAQKEAEEEELAQLKRTRAHEQYLETGRIDPSLLESTASKHDSSRILGAKPYDARAKKKPTQRKQVLDLSDSTSAPQTISEYRKIRNIGNQTPFQVRPYTRKGHISAASVRVGSSSNIHQNYGNGPPSVGPMRSIVGGSNTSMRSHVEPVSTQHTQSTTAHTGITAQEPSTVELSCQELQEKRDRAKKYLDAIASGWKKDRGGSWVKDDDVEFESDEEPPDIS